MYYYQIGKRIVACPQVLVHGITIDETEARQASNLIYLNAAEKNDTDKRKTVYCINHPAYFSEASEDLWCLDTNQMDMMTASLSDIPDWMLKKAEEGKVCGVSSLDGLDEKLSHSESGNSKKRVHIAAMGDVGGTMLIGLSLLGGDVIDSIGIYDFNETLCRRWEHEINQIAYPWQYDRIPRVDVITEAQLFDCDVFIFCASKAIPAVGDEAGDVRMAQLEANTHIIAQYGRKAREAGFSGLFAVVSDPVDLLCQRVYAASNCDADGVWDGNGLLPEQVQGYGLGVMNSRAAYYAKENEKFARFLTEGRAYGPHGSKLVIADSVENYNHEISLELTRKTTEANLEVRALGFKPYIAPALSSAAISILLTLRGEWHYSANYLGGIYMGCKNRTTSYGLELEHLPLPAQLLNRIKEAQDELKIFQVSAVK